MLPALNEDNGQDLMNNYYCVGHTWTERTMKECSYLPRLIIIYLWIGTKTKMVLKMKYVITECYMNCPYS